MDADDPLLQELLDMDEDGNDGEVDSATRPGIQFGLQPGGAQLAPPLGQLGPGQLAQAPPVQPAMHAMQAAAAQQQAQLPAAAAAQQQLRQAMHQGQALQGRKLLGSHTLTLTVSLLLKLMQNDQLRSNQVKNLIREAQNSPINSPEASNQASKLLLSKLADVVGQDKVKQAITLANKYKQQPQQQQAAAAQQQMAAQQMPPQQQVAPQQQQLPPQQQMPPPQQMAPQQQMPPQQPQQPQQPPMQMRPAPQPQPPQPQPQQPPRPPSQQQPQQPFPPPPQQQPAAPAAPAFNMHLQQQQQQQQAAAAMAGHMGVAQGLPVGRAPSPAMYPGAAGGASTLPVLPQSQGPAVVPGLGVQQQAASMGVAAPKPKPQPPKRGADAGGGAAGAGGDDGGPAAKRLKGPAGGGRKEREKEGDMHDILDADAFIDMEHETDELMAGLVSKRQMGMARLAKAQLLSEWRVANEMLKQMTKAGLKLVRPECFEVLQLAFQAHATRLLQKAHHMARHRQDTARKVPDMVASTDPRRGVLQIERRERAKHDAKLTAEREELLKAAQSKKADDETKTKAQKAKAELQGKQQASAANAAVVATLGGRGGAKWEKWGGGGGGGAAGGAAAGGKKKGGKKGAAADKDKGAGSAAEGAGAAPAAAADGGTSVQFAEGTRAGDGAVGRLDRAGSSLQHSRSRAALVGLGGGGGEDGSGGGDVNTIHMRDIVAVLERDPMYCRSPLLYSLVNKLPG